MRKLMLAAAAGMALTACHSAREDGPEPFGRLTIEQVSGLVGKPGVAIYDDNAPDMYASGHVPGAKNLRESEMTADSLPKDRSTELIFYCANPH